MTMQESTRNIILGVIGYLVVMMVIVIMTFAVAQDNWPKAIFCLLALNGFQKLLNGDS